MSRKKNRGKGKCNAKKEETDAHNPSVKGNVRVNSLKTAQKW